MERLKDSKLNTPVKVICLVLIAAEIAAALAIYHADVMNLLIFAGFIIFYVQLPGQLIMKVLGFRPDHFSTVLAVGFFTGWAFITLQYFITDLIGTDLLLYGAGPVCSIIWGITFAVAGGRGKLKPFHPKKLSTALFIFITAALLFSLLETQYMYMDPGISEMTYMNPDKGFHIGLINSLSHGYPMECPWFSGLIFSYHIFAELLLSIPVRLFALTADAALLSCGPYLTVYAFGVSAYSFFCEMSTKKNRAGLYCLILLASNIFIARGIDKSIAFLFVLRNENTAGYAMSACFTLAVLIRYWYRDLINKDHSWKKLILVTAVLMLATGIKGPFGLVMVAGAWGTFVLGLIMRKVPFRTVVPLLIMSAGFLLIYMTVLGSKGQGTGEGSLIAMASILEITFFKGPIIALTKSLGLPLIVRYAALLGVFTIFMLTAFFLPFVIGYIRELALVLSGRKEYDFSRVLLYAVFLVGFAAMLVLNFNGHSQIYFGFPAVFFAPMIAFWFFEDKEETGGIPTKLVRGIFVITLVLCSVTFLMHYIPLFETAASTVHPTEKPSKYQSISLQEYKAMRWIDENTPTDSLLATDRYYSCKPEKYDVDDRWDNRFFLYADYSNRICYLAGSGYNIPSKQWQTRQDRIEINDQLFDADDPNRGDLARKLGVDYVVVSKRFSKETDLENADYQLCFSNDDINVYQVTQ